MTDAARPQPTPDEALARLLEGNRRFAADRLRRPRQSPRRRAEVSAGQAPFAVILGCADSRVPPEVIFDKGLGDLLVIRTAGHVVDDAVLGSIEFGADHLEIPLVMVLAHSECGAVKAALAGGSPAGKQTRLLEMIRPACAAVRDRPGDPVDNAVREHGRRVAAALAAAPEVIAPRIADGRLRVVAAHYDLASGEVELLD
jgi:carbonic anhydrase